MEMLRGFSLALLCAAGGEAVLADVDLTGSWNVTTIGPTVTVEAVQSGPALTFGVFEGTIDPATGVFELEGPPSPGGVLPLPGAPGGVFPYGPSPPSTMAGQASADGNSLDATVVSWIIKLTPPIDFTHFPHFGFPFQAHGVRRNLATCGNGQLDAQEFCDDGPDNGSNDCCSAVCTLVDGDHDNDCDAEDDCPTIYDPQQTCAKPLVLVSAHASSNGRLRTRGTFSDLGSFTEVAVSVGSSSHTAVITRCVASASGFTHARCTNADQSVYLRLRREPPALDWTFQLNVRGLPSAVPEGPISVSIVDRSNSRIASGQLENCTADRVGLLCRP